MQYWMTYAMLFLEVTVRRTTFIDTNNGALIQAFFRFLFLLCYYVKYNIIILIFNIYLINVIVNSISQNN